MKSLIVPAVLLLAGHPAIRAQESSPASRPAGTEVPKGYEVGEQSLSPDGGFAILYPVRGDENSVVTLPPNVLVRLKPYTVLAQIGDKEEGGRWRGARGEPVAKWNGNSIVAIWLARKWGIDELAIYEIENNKIKRVQPIWREVRKYFDRDLKERFLKKYPKESDYYTFVSEKIEDAGGREIEFKGRKLLLNLFADNKPNLAAGPRWTAELHGTWDIDNAKFEKVDFQPGKISILRDH